MKISILIISFFSMFNLDSNQGDNGINFNKEGLEYAIQIAKKENKLIFLDAYTTWCGPCKLMSKNVFSDEKVGTYFNQNFINVKIDMDSDEGFKIAQKYSVTAYPTMLFINGKGESVTKIIGYHSSKELLSIAGKVQSKIK